MCSVVIENSVHRDKNVPKNNPKQDLEEFYIGYL